MQLSLNAASDESMTLLPMVGSFMIAGASTLKASSLFRAVSRIKKSVLETGVGLAASHSYRHTIEILVQANDLIPTN